MEESAASAGTDKLERPGAIADDALHLKRRVGLLSGVALIVGTMIGKHRRQPIPCYQNLNFVVHNFFI